MTQQSNPQNRQRAREWWNGLSEPEKKQHQNNFQNKNAPTEDEIATAYEQSGQSGGQSGGHEQAACIGMHDVLLLFGNARASRHGATRASGRNREGGAQGSPGRHKCTR